MTRGQKEFLKSVGVKSEPDAIRNSVVAAFQRNHVYRDNPSLGKREDLHCALRAEIRRIAVAYLNPVPEDTHCNNICNLADQLTNQFSDILDGNRFRIGTAQKALNLYLKFLWCLGIHKHLPTSCPLDGKILKKVSIYKSWTKLDCIATYQDWMNRIKKIADPQSIPEWELENWKR